MKKISFLISTFLLFTFAASAQINQGLSATATHSGGGAGVYGPSNYNDGVIPAGTSTPWGWVSTSGWIEYTWASPTNFNAIAFHKADRPMSTCTIEYWDGSQFVAFYTYNSAVTPYDSITFPTVSTTRLRFNTVAGSSNPNHREISVWLNSFAPNDAAIARVDSPSVFCAGNENIVVTVANYGTTPIDSVDIDWEFNGVPQTGMRYIGFLDTIGGTNPSSVQVVLGNMNFPTGSSNTIKAWTSNPNGVADTSNANDTALAIVGPALQGSFTVNPAAPASTTNFQTMTAMANAFNNNGVCGPVTVNVSAGVYNESVELSSINGASAINTITIDGGDSTTTSIVHNGSGNIATVTIENTDWITIKNFTIEATGTSGASVLMTGAVNNCTISNNILRVNTTSTSSLVSNVTFSGSKTSPTTTPTVGYNDNTIAYNRIIGGYYGVRMYGPFSQVSCLGNSIMYNQMDSIWYFGAYVYYQDEAEVVGNYIDQATRGNALGDGIYMYTNNNGKINGNYVIANDYGLYWSNSNTRLLTQYTYNEVVNNMVISNNDFAAYLYSVDSVNFWYNSLQTYGGSPALYIAGSTAYPMDDWDLRNNILSAAGGGFALDMQTYTDTIFVKMDNNDYYTTGTTLIDINNTTYATLAAYQTAQPLFNGSSLEGDPQFLSATDLHIIGGFVNDSGDASVPVFVDIDGETRPRTGAASVDMGADEFDPPTCLPATNLVVYNVGLSSATLTWDASAVGATYEYILVPGGTPASSGTGVITSLDSVTVTGLTPSSVYDYYVRVICGRGDTSLWIGPTSFNTANGIPFLEDFESFPAGITGNPWPNGWTSTTTSNPKWESEDANNGNNENSTGTGPLWDHTYFGGPTNGMYVYMETSGGAGGIAEYISAPIFIDSNLSVVELSYWYFMVGATMGTMEVYADSNGTRNLLATYTGQQQTAQTDPWLQASHFLNGYNGKSVQIIFKGTSGTSFTSDMALDDIRLDPVLALDAGVTDVVQPSGSLCPGNVTPIVEIRNFGASQLDSVKVYWDINGALDSTTYVGTIAPGAVTNVSLSTINVMAGQLYNVLFYTGDVNGQADQFNGNDSLALTGLRTGLAGIVTLDPSLPASGTNFIDFASLTATLNNYGVCGNAVVNVANGVYSGAIQFDDIPGASSANTLTIDGGDSSLTTLIHNGSGNAGTVTLNRTSWITLKNMTIQTTGVGQAATVLLTGGNDNVEITNNILRSNRGSTSSIVNNVVYSGSVTSTTTIPGTGFNSNLIANNRIIGGYYGIRMYGPTSFQSADNAIMNNEIDSAWYYGAWIYYQDSAVVSNNVIDLSDRANIQADGIYMLYNNNGKIIANTITTQDWGLYWSNTNINLPSLNRSNEVINNMISTSDDYGAYIYGVDSMNFWYNSINSGQTAALWINTFASYPITNWDLRNNILQSTGSFALDIAGTTDSIFDKLDNNVYNTINGANLIDINNTLYANLPAYQTASPLLNTRSLEGDPQFLTATDLHITGAFVNDSGDASVPIFVDIDGDVRPSVNGNGVDIGADEFDPPTCPPAFNLRGYDQTLDSATIAWASTQTGVTFEYVVVLGGAPQSSGTGVITSADSARLGGLTPSTRYDFYVRVICGRGDTSIWFGPSSFNTANGIPYMQDFQTWPGNITGLINEEGWYTLGTPTPHWEVGTSTSSSNTGPTADHTVGPGGTFVYLECSGGTTGNTDTLWSAPIYFAPNQDSIQLKYWYHMFGAAMGSLEVYADTNGVLSPLLSSWVGQQQTTQGSPWLPDSANLIGYNGKSVVLVFVGIRGTSFTSDMAIDDVSLTHSMPVGIEDETADAGPQFRLSPNPSDGEFMINIKTDKIEQMQMTITDMNGKVVHDESITVNKFYNRTMDMGHLANGMYFLRLQNDDHSKIQKIVIR